MPLAPTRTLTILRKALSFDGIDDYGEIDNTALFDPNSDFTIVVYIKPYSFPETNIGIFTGKYSVYPGNIGWALQIYDKRVLFRFADGTTQINALGTTYMTTNTWYMLTGVRNGNTAYAYINTTLDASADLSTLGSVSTPYIYIARFGQGFYFSGEIAFILVYNKALSDTEISQIYTDPDHPPKSGLVLWLHDTSIDIENNTWKDLSGNGNDATIYGATAVDVVRPATRVINATRVVEPVR